MTRTRLAGSGRWSDVSVTWSIADGRRGRRWREVTSIDGTIIHSLLLETDPERRFRHLELSIAGVLVTLHPEPDGTLHGNRVGPEGVYAIAGLPFGPEGSLAVEGSPLAAAAIVWRRRVAGHLEGATGGALLDATGHVQSRDGDLPLPVGLEVDEDGVPRLDDARVDPLDPEP